MDAFSDPLVEEVVWMASSQVGKSEVLLNVFGYHIDQDPCPAMLVEPDLILAEAFSKDRIAPMLRDTPCLREAVGESKKRDSNNTILHKKFKGGHLTIAGAKSPASLASRPIRLALCDEIDRYDRSAGKEGDPVNLAFKRTTTFFNRKKAKVSTPVLKGDSPIEESYEASDKRRYYVPCPHCNHEQTLRWPQLKFEKGRPETAKYQCESCEQLIDHSKKAWIVSRGRWIAEKPFKGIAGFHINQLYSPWSTWEEVVKEWIASKDNPEKLKTFVNTVLGESWEQKGEAPEWRRIYERREPYKIGTVPAGGVFLTAAVDVQKSRLELEVKAWGKGRQSWSVTHEVLEGDTAEDDVWNRLTEQLGRTFPRADGARLPIFVMAVDTGYNTQRVYDWCRKWPGNRVIPVDGRQGLMYPVGTPSFVDIDFKGQKIRRGLRIYPVGTDHIKTELYGWLRLPKPLDGEAFPPGYCHYPEYDREWFEQLTAENLVHRKKGGKTVWTWEKHRERNEALDLHVYNRAAAALMQIDRYTDEDWDKIAPQFSLIQPATHQPAPRRTTKSKRPRSSYLRR